MPSTKKKSTKSKSGDVKINKSAFIREHADKKPADIIALGQEAGITLTPTFVYSVRNAANRKSKGGSPTKGKPGPKPKSASARAPHTHGHHYKTVLGVVVDIGADAAKALVEHVASELKALS